MKSIYLTKALLFLFISPLLAQPGGGGGLVIDNFYDADFNEINIYTSQDIEIRTFLLTGDQIYQETFVYQQLLKRYDDEQSRKFIYDFHLPPSTAAIEGEWSYDNREEWEHSDQRVYIIYQGDTMVVDLLEIINENGAGHEDRMDSLVFQPGYFKYHRSYKNGIAYDYRDFDRNRMFFIDGLTPSTINKLTKEGYLFYSSNIDLSFLLEEYQPASFFLKRAAYYLKNNEIKLALLDIDKGIEKNNGEKNCEVLFLLCDAYTKAKQYNKAIESISQALDCQRYSWTELEESKIANYRNRIQLFIKLNRFDLALADYEAICVIKPQSGWELSRTRFKLKYLNDYKDAHRDLKRMIDAIPEKDFRDGHRGYSKYPELYFTFGEAEFLLGHQLSACKYWLRAEEFGYSRTRYRTSIPYFDSLITEYPSYPLLYLTRAVALFNYTPYAVSSEKQKKSLHLALKDLEQAEKLGLNDFRIHLYRARVLNKVRKYDLALREIEKAILKNDRDPRCYYDRHLIRSNLGQVKHRDKNDPDFMLYKKLLETWVWERY